MRVSFRAILGVSFLVCAALLLLGSTPALAEANYSSFPKQYSSGTTAVERANQRMEAISQKYRANMQARYKEIETQSPFILTSSGAGYDQPQRGASPYYQESASAIAYITTQFTNLLRRVGSLISGLLDTFMGFLTDMFTNFTSFFTDTTTSEVATKLTGEKMIEDDAKAHRSHLDTRKAIRDDAKMNVEIEKDVARERMRVDQQLAVTQNPDLTGPYCARITAETRRRDALGAQQSALTSLASVGARRSGGRSAGGGSGGGSGGSSGGVESDTARGPLQELENRISTEILFCDPNGDLNGAAEAFCPATCSAGASNGICGRPGPTLQAMGINKARDIYNLDVNYTNSISNRKTFGLGKYYYIDESSGFEPGQNRTVAADVMIADTLKGHIFREAVTPLGKEHIERAYNAETNTLDSDVQQFLLDYRSLRAKRSVAKNSFDVLLSRKMPTGIPSDDQETLYTHVGELFGLEDEDLVNASDELANYLAEFQENEARGLAPSYEAQLEFMAKLIYQNGSFMGTLGGEDDSDGANLTHLLTATAVNSIVQYDLMESLQRQEVLLSTLLELKLKDYHDRVEGLSAQIRGGQ